LHREYDIDDDGNETDDKSMVLPSKMTDKERSMLEKIMQLRSVTSELQLHIQIYLVW